MDLIYNSNMITTVLTVLLVSVAFTYVFLSWLRLMVTFYHQMTALHAPLMARVGYGSAMLAGVGMPGVLFIGSMKAFMSIAHLPI